MTDREFFAQEVLTAGKHTIVACRSLPTGGGEWSHVFHAAVRDEETREVWALVILYFRNRNSRASCNFYYKALDETVGPFDHAPDIVLRHLTPTGNEHANKWRAASAAANAVQAAKPKPRRGDTVTFTRAYSFSDGVAEDTFVFVERNTFYRSSDNGVVRIPRWRSTEYQVTTSA